MDRVLNVLKSWIKSNFQDFKSNPDLLQKLKSFLPVMRFDFKRGTDDFEGLLEKQIMSSQKEAEKDSSQICDSFRDLAAQCELQTDNFLNFDALEIAKQITLMEWKYFSAIRPFECLDQSWNKKETQLRSPNIMALIKHLNHVCIAA